MVRASVLNVSDDDLLRTASAVRQGTTRLARRLRMERAEPRETLLELSVLAHLNRRSMLEVIEMVADSANSGEVLLLYSHGALAHPGRVVVGEPQARPALLLPPRRRRRQPNATQRDRELHDDPQGRPQGRVGRHRRVGGKILQAPPEGEQEVRQEEPAQTQREF